MVRTAGSLQALLTNLIDYAGLFPPAALPLAIVTERYQGFLSSPEKWILNRLVLPAAELPQVQLRDGWRVTLLVDEEPGRLPPQVETLETKAALRLSLPTYCEVSPARAGGAFAKIRTGGLTPDAIPSSADLAAFLREAAACRVPFKATAGLHHAIRSRHALTYAHDAPQDMMHGFLNVFVAAVFAWHGVGEERLIEVLEETDPSSFVFRDDAVRWADLSLTTPQIHAARRDFAHSFGSCSFEEPVSELRDLELLP